jgi:hypothetical protein
VHNDTPNVSELVSRDRVFSANEHDTPCVPQLLEHPEPFPVRPFAKAANSL